MKAITLRNIPRELAIVLERRARAEGKSRNRIVLELLSRACGLDGPAGAPVVHHELDGLFGSWSAEEARELDEALRGQRKIDPELWR